MASISSIIRETRIKRAETVYALSKRTGVSLTHLYAIEAGQKSPTVNVLLRILKGLDMTLEVINSDGVRLVTK